MPIQKFETHENNHTRLVNTLPIYQGFIAKRQQFPSERGLSVLNSVAEASAIAEVGSGSGASGNMPHREY